MRFLSRTGKLKIFPIVGIAFWQAEEYEFSCRLLSNLSNRSKYHLTPKSGISQAFYPQKWTYAQKRQLNPC